MDKKIELDLISEEMFNELLSKAHADILEISSEAKKKIDEILQRLNLECTMCLTYKSLTNKNNLSTEKPVKKKRGRKPKSKSKAN